MSSSYDNHSKDKPATGNQLYVLNREGLLVLGPTGQTRLSSADADEAIKTSMLLAKMQDEYAKAGE